jgi:multiple sugar transport system ATP-binding protein
VAELRFEGVSKVYPDGTQAVSGASLTVPDAAFCVLVGPSGCGKTTLLRMVAGLEDVTAGDILIDGRRVNDVPPKLRDVAMVFQNYALYPHMSVYDNIGFSLKLRHEPKRVIDGKVRGATSVLGLDAYLERQPRLLSGGQRQRVAMGRAIVREPQVMLMDEPLSNLDAKLRVQMRTEIGKRQRELGVTTMYVTHDQTEAMTLGDLVAVFRQGVIQQIAAPHELFDDPANIFVASFIGSPSMNLLEGTVQAGDGGLELKIGSSALSLPEEAIARWPPLASYRDRRVVVGIRPEDVASVGHGNGLPSLPGRVQIREVLGRFALVHAVVDARPAVTAETLEVQADVEGIEDVEDVALTQEGQSEAAFTAMVEARMPIAEGERVEIGIDARRLYFFDPATGASLRAG